MSASLDEEALAASRPRDERRERGAYYTPAWLVTRVIDAVAPWVPRTSLRVVDPACGAGAFLVQARARWPDARPLGVELDARTAATCRARVPGATVLVGDALASRALDDALPDDDAFELWLGNPPWNGTSPLLRDAAAWRRATAWLPSQFSLRRGTSLRDDFVFFLLRASARLEGRAGALAFVTPATLLDAFAHAPVREALLSRLTLREVHELLAGTFAGTKVAACVTVWTSRSARRGRAMHVGTATPAPLSPAAPQWRLRPVPKRAAALDAEWRAHGATLAELVPVSFAGLKTRFDELLVDDDRERLAARLRDFLSGGPLPAFARRHGLETLLPKLAALRAFAGDARFDAANVRRFVRYRGPLPARPPGWCYVDRRMIPRGDHRLRGDFDPHRATVKLVFNAHELPLAAHVLDGDGCVTMYRHTRFAPLEVPRSLLEDPLDARPSGPLVPNLTPAGEALAARLGGPRAVFEHVARHVMSDDFQRHWAPAFGAAEPPRIATRTRSGAARPTRGPAPRRAR